MFPKKYILLISTLRVVTLWVIFLIPLSVFAQKTFKAGLIAGISTSQYDGDSYYGYHKLGFTAGGFVKTNVNDKWAFQFEIAYVQKGARKNIKINSSSEYRLFLNYIEVPLIAKLNFKSFILEANLGFGALIYAKEISNGLDITGMRKFDNTEVTFGLGISYAINKRIDVNWRFTYSLLPVRPYASGATYRFRQGECNNVFAYSLRFNLGKNE